MPCEFMMPSSGHELDDVLCARGGLCRFGRFALTLQVLGIIDDLFRFQQSEYAFDVVSFIREYLLAVSYKEELLRLVDEENFKCVCLMSSSSTHLSHPHSHTPGHGTPLFARSSSYLHRLSQEIEPKRESVPPLPARLMV